MDSIEGEGSKNEERFTGGRDRAFSGSGIRAG